jgi:hypothetical protein
MACNTQQYNLGVRNILLGSDTYQQFCIEAKADVSSSLNNKYIVIHRPGDAQAKHYFWFNVASGGTDPAVPNATGHAVAIAANATGAAVASALQAVINALTWINATVDLAHITCTMAEYGYAHEARNGFGTNSPSFVITLNQKGSEQVDLGGTNGDITMTVEETTKEIKAPQFGDYLLDELHKGTNVSFSFELKDSSVSMIRKIMNFSGVTFVSDDADSETVTGYGSGSLFRSKLVKAEQCILRPTVLADSADPSEDFTLHKASLKLGEMALSADNELVLPVEVMGYLDTTKSGLANFFSYGDASKIPNA